METTVVGARTGSWNTLPDGRRTPKLRSGREMTRETRSTSGGSCGPRR